MDMNQAPTSGWDQMGDLTSLGGNIGGTPSPPSPVIPTPLKGQAEEVPYYLQANNPKVQAVAQKNGVDPGAMVAHVKTQIASGQSTPKQAQAALDSHYQNAMAPSMPDISGERPPGENDWQKAVLGVIDQYTGKNFSAGYTPPPSKLDVATYQNKLGGAQSELLGRDPNSQLSQNARNSTIAALKSALPGQDVTKLVPATMSANEIANDPNIKAALTGGYSVQGNQLKAQAMNGRAENGAASNALRTSKDYESKMEEYKNVNQDISRVEAGLNTKDASGKPLISPQQLADVNLTIARIFSPKHMSDSTVNATEYQTIPAEFAAAVQKWTADPTDVGSRKIIDHIIDQAHHIGNVTNQNAIKELDSQDSGLLGVGGGVGAVAQKKSDLYRQRFSKVYQPLGQVAQAIRQQRE